ncbi:MAG: preprotein translocase subunit YajC [Nitrospinota bacterium]
MWVEWAYALGRSPGQGNGGPAGGIGSLLLPFAMVFAIIYFLMIRPQQKKQADHRRMLESMVPGDQVMTSGGIYGTVSKIKEDKVWLEIADNVRIRVQKSNIAAVTGRGGGSKAKEIEGKGASKEDDEDD